MSHRFPIRVLIAVMIFFGAYTNFAVRSNMSVSVISMTSHRKSRQPDCLPKKQNVTSAPLPDYGPRYDWNEAAQAWILSGYFYGHVITGFLSGTIAEWWGPKATIFWFTLISAVVNALCVIGAWHHYMILFALRLLLGMLGSCVYPALQVLIAKWAPPAEKGKFSAVLMGNALATIFNWPIISIVTVHWGWDWGIYIISFVLLVYALVFYILVSDTPEQHRFISEDEVNFIKESQAGSVSKKKMRPPYCQFLKSIPLWALFISHFGSMWGLYLQLHSIPKYMVEVIGYDLKKSGFLAMLPHLSRLMVGLVTGFLTDWLKEKGVVTSKSLRRRFTFFSHIVPGLLLIAISLAGCNAIIIIGLLIASLGSNGTSVITNIVNPQDLAPNFSGTIFGICSFVGSVSGFIVPKITELCIKDHNGAKEWGINFYIGGVMYVIAGVIFILFASVDEQEWNREPQTTT